MADTFDLRKFLTENKLTKNAQFLKEDDNYKYFDEEGVGGFYMTTIDGVKIYSLEDSSIMDTCGYALVEPETTYMISVDVSGEPVDADYVEQDSGVTGKVADFIVNDINSQLEEEGLLEGSRSMKNRMNEGSDYGYEAVIDAIADHFDEGSYEYDQVLAAVEDAFHNNEIDTSDFSHSPSAPSKVVLDIARELGLGEYESDEPQSRYVSGRDIEEGKSYKVSKNSKEAQHLRKGDIIGSGDEVVSVSAGAKTPSGKVEVTVKTKDGKTKTSTWGKYTKIGVKEKETVKESALSAREKYLTRLVENALGLEGYGDDNVNKQREKQGLPPAQGPKYSEGVSGDEMANETAIPEYSSIDELMKSIDHGTNKVAEEHKIQEMKKIAEALRMKAKNMEESEHAQHINPKDLKQLSADAAKLEKAAEKLKAAFDKKFNKKEKAAPKKAEEKPAALAEGFD